MRNTATAYPNASSSMRWRWLLIAGFALLFVYLMVHARPDPSTLSRLHHQQEAASSKIAVDEQPQIVTEINYNTLALPSPQPPPPSSTSSQDLELDDDVASTYKYEDEDAESYDDELNDVDIDVADEEDSMKENENADAEEEEEADDEYDDEYEDDTDQIVQPADTTPMPELVNDDQAEQKTEDEEQEASTPVDTHGQQQSSFDEQQEQLETNQAEQPVQTEQPPQQQPPQQQPPQQQPPQQQPPQQQPIVASQPLTAQVEPPKQPTDLTPMQTAIGAYYQGTPRYLAAADQRTNGSTCEGELKPQPLPQSLYFLHIPKAGGSAFVMRLLRLMFGETKSHSIFQHCYGQRADGTYCTDEDWDDKGAKGPNALPRPTSNSWPCSRVLNCLDHRPNIKYLGVAGIPSAILIRDPLARLVSGWHFGFPHHPEGNVTFEEYVHMNAYTDIMTRMLGGYLYPYTNEVITEKGWSKARWSMETLDLVLIQEAWQTSVRLTAAYFGYAISPDSIYFDSDALMHATGIGKPRVNNQGDYERFKSKIISNHRWMEMIREQNTRDYILYDRGVERFCNLLSRFPCILRDPVVIKELSEAGLCQHLYRP